MGDVRLAMPRVRAVVMNPDGTLDALELQVLNWDLLLFEKTARIHKWRTMKDDPQTWFTFVAWAAGTRTGVVTDEWEHWSKHVCAEVTSLDTDDDDDDADPGDPTQPGPEPG